MPSCRDLHSHRLIYIDINKAKIILKIRSLDCRKLWQIVWTSYLSISCSYSLVLFIRDSISLFLSLLKPFSTSNPLSYLENCSVVYAAWLFSPSPWIFHPLHSRFTLISVFLTPFKPLPPGVSSYQTECGNSHPALVNTAICKSPASESVFVCLFVLAVNLGQHY